MFSMWQRILPASVRPKLQSFPSYPWPQRLSAQDTNAYRQPIPPASGNFLTFWEGNQLPGSFMHVTAHTQYLVYKTQDFVQPQLNTQASFGSNLSQIPAAQLLANWRSMWSSASGRYGQG